MKRYRAYLIGLAAPCIAAPLMPTHPIYFMLAMLTLVTVTLALLNGMVCVER